MNNFSKYFAHIIHLFLWLEGFAWRSGQKDVVDQKSNMENQE